MPRWSVLPLGKWAFPHSSASRFRLVFLVHDRWKFFPFYLSYPAERQFHERTLLRSKCIRGGGRLPFECDKNVPLRVSMNTGGVSSAPNGKGPVEGCAFLSLSPTSLQFSIARRENERRRLGESGERFVVAFRESPYLATIRKISPGIRMSVARTSLEIRIFLSTREGSLRVSLSVSRSLRGSRCSGRLTRHRPDVPRRAWP